MKNCSLLLQKNNALFSSPKLLLAGVYEDQFCLELLSNNITFDIFTYECHVYEHLKKVLDEQKPANCALIFDAVFSSPSIYDQIIIYARKSRNETAFLIDMLAPFLREGGEMFLVGENKAGIKSQCKLLTALGTVHKADGARHCSLFRVTKINKMRPFQLNNWLHEHEIVFQGKTVTLCSLPGVFSFGRLDKGTKVLLEYLERQNLKGNLLDFGCGCGVIGACASLLTSNNIDTLRLLDNNKLALLATSYTFKKNNLPAPILLASDLFSALDGKASSPCDMIITNPPFHKWLRQDLSITRALLASAEQFLVKRGKLLMVANSFLPYQNMMKEYFSKSATVFAKEHFTVYQGIK